MSSTGTLGTRSFERSELVRTSDTHDPKPSDRVLSDTLREACETPTIQTTPIDLSNYVTKDYLKEQLAFKDSYLKEQLALKDQHFQTELSLRDHQIASLSDQLEHQQAAFASLREFVERSLSHTRKGKAIANTELKLSVSKQAPIPVSSEAAFASTGPMTSVSKQLPIFLEIPVSTLLAQSTLALKDNPTEGEKRVEEQEKVAIDVDLLQDAFQTTGTYDEFGDEMEEELEERIDERMLLKERFSKESATS